MYKSISIGGTDAVEFLQGQLTQDIARLQDVASLPAAWCNPKGRVVTTVRLNRGPEGIIDLLVPENMVDAVVARLTMYRLRSDVQIEPRTSDWVAVATCDANDLQILEEIGLLPEQHLNSCATVNGVTAVSLGLDDCVEIYGSLAALDKAGLKLTARLSDDQWRAARVNAGLPDIEIHNSEKYTPHMLNLDLTGAVSFDKGCYTGQEIVARTENLGKSRRRLMRYRFAGDAPSIGDTVSDGERDVGSVVNVGDGTLLAVTPVTTHEQTLFVHDNQIEPA
jgi:folate-binding protein YgfZ